VVSTWTKTPPTKPGAFWWRSHRGDKEPILIKCYERDGLLIDDGSFEPPGKAGGEWCGPLVPAEEVEKAFEEGFKDGQFTDERLDVRWLKSRAKQVVEVKL
jgi:hypothetical protein